MVKLLLNWTVVLTSPIWIMPVLIYFILVRDTETKDSRMFFDGKRWFFE